MDTQDYAIPKAPYFDQSYRRLANDYVIKVGQHVASYVKGLRQLDGADLKWVHLIGFGLGGHAAGLAGEIVKKEVGIAVGRITGKAE